MQRIFGLDLPIDKWAAEEGIADQEITERLLKEVDDKARAKEAEFGPETMRQIEKMVLLQTLDHLWREHLVTLEHLRQVIGFRSYGQRDPLNEYKSEGFHLFETMLASLREAVTGQLMHIQGVPRGGAEMQEVGAAAHAGATTSIRSRARTSWPWPTRRWRPEPARRARLPSGARPLQTRRSGERGQPEGPRHLGQGGAQRAVSRAARARNTSTATASTTDAAASLPLRRWQLR